MNSFGFMYQFYVFYFYFNQDIYLLYKNAHICAAVREGLFSLHTVWTTEGDVVQYVWDCKV